MSAVRVENTDGLVFMESVSDGSVDLVLTDPPYITSRSSGMDALKRSIDTGTCAKTEADWDAWTSRGGNAHKQFTEAQKQNYLTYGSIYGKKYAVATDYGAWDSEFSIDALELFVKKFYKKLRKGGTCIIFFDLWKIAELKGLMEAAGFKQIRMIEWVKTNPQPLNSATNYLTNCKEFALTGVKGSKPTFNSKYDNGIYNFPLQGGKDRFHPTQKSTKLFEELVKKHSNEGDLVMDTFLGSGTTANACVSCGRRFVGCESNKEYFDKMVIKSAL